MDATPQFALHAAHQAMPLFKKDWPGAGDTPAASLEGVLAQAACSTNSRDMVEAAIEAARISADAHVAGRSAARAVASAVSFAVLSLVRGSHECASLAIREAYRARAESIPEEPLA